MNRAVWRCGSLVLFGGVLALAGCGGGTGGGTGGPFPDLSPPVSSKPDGNGLITQIRPQVASISDSDPLQVVLHWEGASGPLNSQTGAISVNWPETFKTLAFHVTTPDGQKLTLKTAPPKIQAAHPAELFSSPTLFVKLTRKGMEVSWFEYRGDWTGGPVAALEATGTFRLSVSGELLPGKPDSGKPIPFASGVVSIKRGVEGYESLDTIADIARARVGRKLSSGHEMGGQIYDDADGNRLVHLTGPSSKQWHFTIHTIQVSPSGKVLNVFSREVSNCLAEGTELEGERGPVLIEKARVGDRLWGYDLKRGARVLTTIRAIRRGEANETLRLGCGLRLTGDHPLHASGQWVPARQLSEMDVLLRANGETSRVGKIEWLRERVAVHDVTVDEPHNFFAGGVLVHNKDRDYSPQLDDLWYRLWSPEVK
jgi:hypothetical protein